MSEPIKLNIGGVEPSPGWKILNIQPGPDVDFVGNCSDLSRFADESVETIYASHVLEHLGYQQELHVALKEFHRILIPGGDIMISVPDLERCCQLFVHPQATPDLRFYLMRVMFGGQIDPYDFHKVGLTFEFLSDFLKKAGFRNIERVEEFGLFKDTSGQKVVGVFISLNVKALK